MTNPMLYPNNELVITDANYRTHAAPHVDADGTRSMGLVPRDYGLYPVGSYPGESPMRAVDMPIISPADFPARIKELEDTGTRLSDFRNRGKNGQSIPSRDQNGKGYCWAHSGVSAMLLARARDDMPYVDLSAYAVACIIKQYQDEGGWGAQGLDFLMQKGVPSSQFWPQQSMSKNNDKPETWANAALHKFTEGWIDVGAQYNRNLTFNQTITCLLCRIPVIIDLQWWSHSICGADAVNGTSLYGVTRGESGKLMTGPEFAAYWGINDPVTAGIAIRIWNSWGDSWSDNGMGVLTGNKAVPDGATAPRVTNWSAS